MSLRTNRIDIIGMHVQLGTRPTSESSTELSAWIHTPVTVWVAFPPIKSMYCGWGTDWFLIFPSDYLFSVILIIIPHQRQTKVNIHIYPIVAKTDLIGRI